MNGNLAYYVLLKVNSAPIVTGRARTFIRAGAYLPFPSTRNISTPPGWNTSPSQVTSQHYVRLSKQFAGSHFYTYVERGTLRVSPKNTT